MGEGFGLISHFRRSPGVLPGKWIARGQEWKGTSGDSICDGSDKRRWWLGLG